MAVPKTNGLKISTLIGPTKKKEYTKEAEHLFKTVGKTFYIVKGTNKIITFREWYQMGKPECDKSGEYFICSKYLENGRK